jgi:hypothetical protein
LGRIRKGSSKPGVEYPLQEAYDSKKGGKEGGQQETHEKISHHL